MSGPLRIAMVSMEMAPAIKVGGLGDVVSGLSAELRAQGHDVRGILPDYGALLQETERIKLPLDSWELSFAGSPRAQSMSLGRMPHFDGPVYLLDDPGFRRRATVYVDPETGSEYADTAQRCAAFCRGALRLMERIDWHPDIIHVHDFQTAIVPSLLKRSRSPRSRTPASVLTIHNLAFQGVYDPAVLDDLEISADGFFPGGPLEFWGKVNLLKAGILDADAVTTVSEAYAREICTQPELGEGLSGVLAGRGADLLGIVNGLDTQVWDPATDPHLRSPYDRAHIEARRANKGHLLDRVGLPGSPDRPLVGMVSRLTEQKGLDLLEQGWNAFLQRDVNLVVLGSGESRFENFFATMAREHPDRIAYQRSFDEPLAHMIQAGADILLMPSRYEPCGLTQLIAMRYGTVPVARRVGGLGETVRDVDEAPDRGTGFLFGPYRDDAMIEALDRALRTYEDSGQWEKIMARGMEQDLSWAWPAKRYVELYRRLLPPQDSRRWGESKSGHSARAGASQQGDV